MPFLFTNAALLAALAGLGIPVLLHLLLKRKSQRLRFSTVRFFAKQDEQASSKRKLRNLLLLLLRLLIFALIVLAFARPYLPLATPNAAGGQRRQMVLVLDRSLSLQATDTGGARWPRLQAAAGKLLGTFKADDQAALVVCSDQATIASGFASAQVIAKTIAELPPGTGTADLADGFREAAKLLATADPKAVSSVVVLSDLQRASSANLASAPLPEGIEVQLLPNGDLAAPNLAIADLNLEGGQDALPHVTIAHHGDEALAALETELRLDGKSVSVKTVPLKAGATTNLDLRLPALKPGWHQAEFRVRAQDSLAADDRRFQSVFVPQPVSVLLVEGRPRPRSFEEQTFFVAAALDPSFGTTNRVPARFSLTKASPVELVASLTAARTNRPAVVVLPAQGGLSGTARAALLAHVQSGGGLLLFGGAETTASAFNTDFADLAPVVLKGDQTADDEFGWHVGEADKAGPLFAPFRPANSGNLALPTFLRRHTVAMVNPSSVHARFEDGTPLVASREVGRGRVAFVNTTADTAWGDWPKHRTYLPWLQNAVQWLAGREGEPSLRAGANLVASSEEELELGSAFAQAKLTLTGPAGKPLALTADAQGRVAFTPAEAGFYLLADAQGREVRRFSANVPTAEADLAAWRPGDLQTQIARTGNEQTNLTEGLFGSHRQHREFWRVLLMAALALVFAETLLSNRSYA
jgi:hypothetical protein